MNATEVSKLDYLELRSICLDEEDPQPNYQRAIF